MQKPVNRILSALIVLVMVMTMLPASVFASDDAELFAGWSLTLGDNIGVNFYLQEEAANYTVTTTVAGAEAAHTATTANGYYVVTVNVAAAQMTDVIGLTVLNGETQAHAGEYSVRQYALEILEGDYDAEVKEMVKAMLNYGAAAQTYFSYNTSDLANSGYEADLTAIQVPTEESLSPMVLSGSVKGVETYGMSLIFRSKTAVRFYFNITGDVNSYTFKVNGEACEPQQKDDRYYVEVDEINPQALGEMIELAVTDGTDTISISYSPLHYIARKYYGDGSEALKGLLQSMQGYYVEAQEYEAYQQIVKINTLSAATQYGSNGLDITDGNVKNIYATTAANTAPGGDWSYEYTPMYADGLQLIRDGETYDVGVPGSGTIVKFADAGYCIKLEAWTVADSKLPLQENDILVIDGRYKLTSDSSVVVDFGKTYIYYDGSSVEFSAEMPTLPTTYELGSLIAHPDSNNNWSSSGVYMALSAATDAPNGSWSLEYAPTSSSVIKRIRDGVTIDVAIADRGTLVMYNATNLYMNINSWTMGENQPALDGDIYIIEGDFYNKTHKATITIAKTYIYLNGADAEFSTEMPTLPSTVEGGVMTNHSANGWQSNGVYASMASNAAPYDGWNVEYSPVAAENLKLIRDGVTYNIGIPGRGTLVKYNETDYFLKMEWNVGDYAPLLDGDILIVEGGFVNEASKVTLNIAKTYIYANGSKVEFSTEMPVLETIYEVGTLSAHGNGGSNTGFNATGLENDAPYSGWSAEYAPTSKECIQIIRNGETIYRENTGAGAIVKLGGTSYYVKFDTWIDSANYPLQAGDLIIIEGIFVGTSNYAEAEGVKLKIDKTYVVYDGESFTFSATEPVKNTVVEGGAMSSNAEGWDASDGIYATMAENEVPVDENAEITYSAEAGVVKLVRGGVTYEISASLIKFGAADYYLSLAGCSYLPLQNNDYLIVEGAFSNADNGYTLKVAKTYILVKGDNVEFSTTEPVLEAEYAVNGLTNHGNGWSSDGIYITHNAHSAHFNSDWSVEYKPVSADAIKLIRNGVTTSIGQPASGTLVVYSATDMYFKTAAWTITGGVLPFVDGDIIVIEGKFKHEGTGSVLVVEKTLICVSGTELVFNPILAGSFTNHPNGVSGEGVYATMAENAAPYDGWNIEYTPVTADAYYVIRNGEQINIGIPGRGTLVKYSATEYFLKINAWCTNNFAYTTDDIIVIDGYWKQNTGGNAVMKIEKTYLYYDGSAWTFSTSLPSIVNGGLMQTHENGMSGTGIYFGMAANSAPYDGWNIEYTQTSVDNIKLIRNGETLSIGIVGRPLFVKYGDTNYYLKLEAWTIGQYGLNGADPITTDDVIIVEGNFQYAAENVTLNITKSYIYYDGTAWVCAAEAPAAKNIVDLVDLGKHTNGWTTGGFYFTAAANTAPYDGWSLRYKPVSADVIQCISGGTTTNVGNTGAETIVKYSDTEYYIEGWAIGSANLVAGNVFVIEGLFYNAANDVYINVEKTYITLNADGTISVLNDSDKNINAGSMSAYAPGPNWFGTGIHFALGSNIAPSNEDWTVRYTPASAGNIKLVRNGETIEIANTGAETIVKIADGMYWLSLEAWWWNAYAPIQDGDVLIIEGAFTNASNGYTLNIEKTYITFENQSADKVSFSIAADTEFGEVLLPNTTETLKIGVWNGSYHVFEDKQLQELKDAGITKIMGIDTQWIGTTDVNAWLDRVYSYGISVIMDLRTWDGETVPSYASHPAVIGFLMFDEPCSTDFDTLASLKTKFDAVMPEGKLFYVNLFPSCAAGTSLVGSINWTLGRRDYNTYYVTEFLDKLDVDVLSWDNYSLLSGSGIRTDYFYNFEVMASKNKTMWYTMLSSGHGTTSASYATPTAGELRWQMAVAMTYGVQHIDHYTYVSHESGYSTMVEYDTWEPTDLYYDIKNVDNEYLAWDNIYMAYTWVGVGTHSANSNNAMLTKLSKTLNLSDYGLAQVEADENLLVGVFEQGGNHAYMVTNAGSAGTTTVGDGKNFSMDDATVTLTLGEGSYKCVAVIDNGEISYVAVNADNTVNLTVEAYEGVFVIPVLN